MQLRIKRRQRLQDGHVNFYLTCNFHLSQEARVLIERYAVIERLNPKHAALIKHLCAGGMEYSSTNVWTTNAIENDIIEATQACITYLTDATYYGAGEGAQVLAEVGTSEQGRFARKTALPPLQSTGPAPLEAAEPA